MDWLQQLPLQQFLLFTLVLVRVSGLVMTAPIYGTPEVPMQVRALLAFALALLVTPMQLGAAVSYPDSLLAYGAVVGKELLIGVALGLGVMVVFSGVQLAGETIGRTGGAMLADVYDPSSGTSVPLFSQLMYLLAVAVFVCIGGHRMVMAGLLDTFRALPPGSGGPPPTLAETFVVLVTQSFVLGLRAAAPVLTALLVSNLVLGLIGRTLPQLNILAMGFGVNALFTFGVLALSLGAAVWVFQDQIPPTLEMLWENVQPANP